MEEYQMAAELEEEVFKTTLMGGFDKEDVMAKFREVKNEANETQKKLYEDYVKSHNLNKKGGEV